MQSDSLNVAFFGSSSFVIPILESIRVRQKQPIRKIFLEQLSFLKENNSVLPSWWLERSSLLVQKINEDSFFDKTVNIEIVVSQPDRYNRKKKVTNPVVEYSRSHNLKLFLPEKINNQYVEFEDLFKNTLDIGLVASFGQIISEDILSLPKYGFINWHPSKLPLYRGATPIQTAIRNGDREIALSWIEMIKQMDAGSIYLQLDSNLEANASFGDVAQKMGYLGAETWALVTVAKILYSKYSDSLSMLRPIAQDPQLATFCKSLTKENKYFSPKLMTAAEIYNQFRAYEFFPGTVFQDEYFKSEVKLVECQATQEKLENEGVRYNNWLTIKQFKQSKVYLVCKQDTLLEVNRISLAGGKVLNFSGFQFS
ncbi:MAG: methionyl-tRNA formyltransferase [Patescibacteria group bacterium]